MGASLLAMAKSVYYRLKSHDILNEFSKVALTCLKLRRLKVPE